MKNELKFLLKMLSDDTDGRTILVSYISLFSNINCLWSWNLGVCALSAAAAKSLQSCLTLCDPIDGSPPGSAIPGILQARKNTGVGCHFLLQCMKVKSESEVALSDPMDCSLPGSSIHGIFQARVLEWGAIAFSGALSRCMYFFVALYEHNLWTNIWL